MRSRSPALFVLAALSIMVLSSPFVTDDASSEGISILDIEQDRVLIGASPDGDRATLLNVTIRSPYTQNTIAALSSEFEDAHGWTAVHPSELYLEPLEQIDLRVKITAPAGELAGRSVRFSLELTGSGGIAIGRDSADLEVLPYWKASISPPSNFILDLPVEGTLELPIRNEGNAPGPFSGDVHGPATFEFSIDDVFLEPAEEGTLHLSYNIPADLDRLGLDIRPTSAGAWTGEALNLTFIRDGARAHLMFGPGPYLVLLPTALEGRGALSVLALGGPFENVGIELAGTGDYQLKMEPPMDIDTLERCTFHLEAEGFEGTRALKVQAYGYSEGEKRVSNPMTLVIEGSEGRNRGIDTGLIAASGGAAGGISLLAVTSAYLYSASETFKYRWLLVLFIPLFSLIKPEKVLDHFFRGRLYEYIKANPGVTFTAVKEHFEVNNGTLTYHLHKMEREGLIVFRNLGKYKLFYAEGVRIRGCEVVISPLDKEIMELISKMPGMTSKEIFSLMPKERSRRTFSRHLKDLERKGFIRVERIDGGRRFFLSSEMRRVLMPHRGVLEPMDIAPANTT